MENDFCEHVKKCEQCQKNARLQASPSHELYMIVCTWPSFIWALDFVGVINPHSSEGHQLIIITNEYFTKWVETIPLKFSKGNKIIEFVVKNIIIRFGVLSKLFIDN